MRKKPPVTPSRELSVGMWFQLRARLRPLHPWERPADAEISDDRMVEFFRTDRGAITPDWTGIYYPLLAVDLVPEFLHVFGGGRTAPEKEVEGFYARYGCLHEQVGIEGNAVPAWAERLAPEDRKQLSPEVWTLLCEPIWWLQERARDVRLTYDLYLALKEKRTASLRAMLGGVPEGKRIIGMGITRGTVIRTVTGDDPGAGRRAGSFSMETDPADDSRREAADDQAGDVISARSLRPLTEEECRSWAGVLLASQLNIGEEGSKRRWSRYLNVPQFPTPKDQRPLGKPTADSVGLVRYLSCENLLAAMYMQLGELVYNDTVLRQCPGCNRLFYRHHGKQNYCSLSCGDAARQRGYYRTAKDRAMKSLKGKRKAAKRRQG